MQSWPAASRLNTTISAWTAQTRANVPPEAGAQVTESEVPESSTAEAEKSTIAPEAAVASTVMSDGTVTTGAPKACVEAVPTGTSAESTMASAAA